MSDKETKGLCSHCAYSIPCATWTEWKCLATKRRVPFPIALIACGSYKRRDRNFKEPQCQCEDCLRNEFLDRQEEE